MSDVSQPSPSVPPPQQTEVPVNETPVGSPSPLGSQAPEKPPGQESNKSSHIGRREAIQNAFDRAKQAQEEAAVEAPKRAKPGIGHNKPPEPMEKEAAKPTATQTAERYREAGKFARDPARAAEPGSQPQRSQPLPETAPYREPPPRFSDQAKTEWASAPESVRGAVHQMAREFHGAYERYRGDSQVMDTLRPFHNLAVQQGTSLHKAFENYYGMELKLRQDLIGGLDVIVNNLKLKGPNGAPIGLRDVAYHILNMSPEQHRMTAQQNQQTSADMRIGQLHQMVNSLTQNLGQMQYQQRFSHTRAQVDQFADSHPRFDELADLIKSELDLGFPLEVAYQRAEMLRPSHAAQTRTQSAQTRRTSISGAPDGGTRPSDGRRPATNGEAKHPTRREALAKAFRRVGNGV